MTIEEKLRIKRIKLNKLEEELKLAKEKYGNEKIKYKFEKLNENLISVNASLNISLLEGKEFMPSDFSGKSNPYVVFTLEHSKQLSSFKSNTLSPVWNEDFNM